MNLFIDTTGNELIFILFNDEIRDTFIINSNRQLAENFIDYLDNFLQKNNININNINKLYVTKGPGSFTGVRVGLTFAKALKTTKTSIYTINSLYLGLDYTKDSFYNIDARGNKVYQINYLNNTISKPILVEKGDNIIISLTLNQVSTNLFYIINNNLVEENIEAFYIKEAF